MNVLSLFDGMSCARIALKRARIKVDNYYASEIDKYSQIVSHANFPDIIRLGDINDWESWDIEQPDLIIAGTPCQGFSFAGKQLNFDDPRSMLFFQFIDILNHYEPKYFLLENVKMKQEYQDIISRAVGVEPIEINSALVSAQNRKRLYWTNIPGIVPPMDKGVLLKDIIETGIVDRDKGYCIDANYFKGGNLKQYFEKSRRQLVFDDPRSMLFFQFIDILNHYEPKYFLLENVKMKQEYQDIISRDIIEDGYVCREKSQTIPATIYKENAKSMLKRRKMGLVVGRRTGLCKQIGVADLKGNDSIKRVYSPEGKSPCLTTMGGGHREPKIVDNIDDLTWRKLTPLECERLQTVPDNFTNHVSNTQRYKMLGNGFTVDIIAHILKHIRK